MPLFLHPAALWTLASLALPLALHLWRPPPRTVRLGSLRFLVNAARPLRRLRWREQVLLYTRLGLLAGLSLLLAGPQWVRKPPAGPRHWALLDPTAALAGDALARWRAVRAAGGEMRVLAAGFPTANDPPPPPADTPAPALWSLLREADAELPAGSRITVFSPGRLAALRGVRPVLGHCRVEWVRAPDAGDAPHAWIESLAGSDRPGEVRFTVGHSSAAATAYVSGVLTVPADGPVPSVPVEFPDGGRGNLEAVRGIAGNGGPAISVRLQGTSDEAGRPGPWVAARPGPSPLSVLILHDAERAGDARYVEAAVRAAAPSGGWPVEIKKRRADSQGGNLPWADRIFWLSAVAVPEGLGSAPWLFRDAAGDEPATVSGQISAPLPAVDGIPLWKSIVPSPLAGVAWWTDGQGNPVLTYSHPAAGERWQFSSRFDPDWTDLPRTSALPSWMRDLLFAGSVTPPFAAADPVNDRRRADPAQCLPSDAPATAGAVPVLASSSQTAVDLHWPVWVLVAALFLAERLLSHRRVAPGDARVRVPASRPAMAATPP